MSQIRLYVRATEAICADLLDRLGPAFEEREYAIATQEIDETRDIWEVSAYAEADDEADVTALFSEVVLAHDPAHAIGREDLPDVDWIARSLEGLKPVRAGRYLVHGSHDRAAVRPSDIAIEIEAGQAFGTGHHGTTAGCLEMIDAVLKARKPQRVLDLGTGSGVLALAVAKSCRPARIVATDIDPVAVRVAAENARLNGHPATIRFAAAAGFHSPVFGAEGPFDLVIANILARPLIRLAPQLVTHLAPGGTVILSGILASQRWKVISAYSGQGLGHRRTIWRNGWVTIVLDRPQR